jgi:hypothetical protein
MYSTEKLVSDWLLSIRDGHCYHYNGITMFLSEWEKQWATVKLSGNRKWKVASMGLARFIVEFFGWKTDVDVSRFFVRTYIWQDLRQELLPTPDLLAYVEHLWSLAYREWSFGYQLRGASQLGELRRRFDEAGIAHGEVLWLLQDGLFSHSINANQALLDIMSQDRAAVVPVLDATALEARTNQFQLSPRFGNQVWRRHLEFSCTLRMALKEYGLRLKGPDLNLDAFIVSLALDAPHPPWVAEVLRMGHECLVRGVSYPDTIGELVHNVFTTVPDIHHARLVSGIPPDLIGEAAKSWMTTDTESLEIPSYLGCVSSWCALRPELRVLQQPLLSPPAGVHHLDFLLDGARVLRLHLSDAADAAMGGHAAYSLTYAFWTRSRDGFNDAASDSQKTTTIDLLDDCPRLRGTGASLSLSTLVRILAVLLCPANARHMKSMREPSSFIGALLHPTLSVAGVVIPLDDFASLIYGSHGMRNLALLGDRWDVLSPDEQSPDAYRYWCTEECMMDAAAGTPDQLRATFTPNTMRFLAGRLAPLKRWTSLCDFVLAEDGVAPSREDVAHLVRLVLNAEGTFALPRVQRRRTATSADSADDSDPDGSREDRRKRAAVKRKGRVLVKTTDMASVDRAECRDVMERLIIVADRIRAAYLATDLARPKSCVVNRHKEILLIEVYQSCINMMPETLS